MFVAAVRQSDGYTLNRYVKVFWDARNCRFYMDNDMITLGYWGTADIYTGARFVILVCGG